MVCLRSRSNLPGCRHGSFQPQGSLCYRTYDYLNQTLGGGERITFEVTTSVQPVISGIEWNFQDLFVK